MKKIMIIGSGGAGKSTLSRQLEAITGIEVHHLDCIFWQPGWTSISRENLADKVTQITSGDSWIIDGNYSSTMQMRLDKADTVIYLDFPTIVCLWGIIKRRFMYRNKVRPDITEGCEEKLDWEFFSWVLTFRRRNRAKLLDLLKKYSENKSIHILRSRRQVSDFISKLQKEL